MFIARVIGPVVSTIKNPFFDGKKLLLIKELDSNGELDPKARVAVDFVQAGAGDTVLAMRNGSSLDQLVEQNKVPANLAIIGIVDEVHTSLNQKK